MTALEFFGLIIDACGWMFLMTVAGLIFWTILKGPPYEDNNPKFN